MKIDNQKYYVDILKICLALERNNLLDRIGSNFFKAKKLLDECVDFVSDIFCKYGLKDDDEPNEIGFIMEDLINYLNNCIDDLEGK